MFRTLLVVGTVIDVVMALFLVLVSGWIIDSWHDPKGAWVGIVSTTFWLGAMLLAVGGPIAGWRLKRHQSPPGRIALLVWLPVIVLVGVCVVGFAIAPP